MVLGIRDILAGSLKLRNHITVEDISGRIVKAMNTEGRESEDSYYLPVTVRSRKMSE